MEKITIPNIGTWKSDDLYWFFLELSDLNACWHSDLTEEEQGKVKTATLSLIRDIFTKIEYTEPRSSIRHEHRSFDEDDLERFYRNMWSHREQK